MHSSWHISVWPQNFLWAANNTTHASCWLHNLLCPWEKGPHQWLRWTNTVLVEVSVSHGPYMGGIASILAMQTMAAQQRLSSFQSSVSEKVQAKAVLWGQDQIVLSNLSRISPGLPHLFTHLSVLCGYLNLRTISGLMTTYMTYLSYCTPNFLFFNLAVKSYTYVYICIVTAYSPNFQESHWLFSDFTTLQAWPHLRF